MGRLDGVDIHKLPPGKYGDGNGLWLVKTRSAGSWVIRYGVNGKLRYQGIGGIKDVSLSEAREANQRWRLANCARKDAEKLEAMDTMERNFHDKLAEAIDGKTTGDAF